MTKKKQNQNNQTYTVEDILDTKLTNGNQN